MDIKINTTQDQSVQAAIDDAFKQSTIFSIQIGMATLCKVLWL